MAQGQFVLTILVVLFSLCSSISYGNAKLLPKLFSTTPKFKSKKVIVLGGDGFCGWPTSLHLSAKGHKVIVVDNLSRRHIDKEIGCNSLTPISSFENRCNVWNNLNAMKYGFSPIESKNIDIKLQYDKLLALLKMEKPDVVIHFAEQRAAPYSMKSSSTKRYTVDNNVGGTHNLLSAIVEADINVHVIHLGTMGVYGYGTLPTADSVQGSTETAPKVEPTIIPEGYLDIIIPSFKLSNIVNVSYFGLQNLVEKFSKLVTHRILYPMNPGSVYHLTKCLDALLFAFYAKNDKIRITDLHQGIVWGTNTKETLLDERLINRFDYDSDYGTVLNRFLLQAALKQPLSVYGTGGQKRAFIHISDTVKCIEYAMQAPPVISNKPVSVEIFNQVAESHRVIDLARIISNKTGVPIQYHINPRNELATNELQVSNEKFKSLGWKPVLLEDRLLEEVVGVAMKYKDRCLMDKLNPSSFWNKDIKDKYGAR